MTRHRIKDNICPYCLSKLLNEDGRMVCTGNKLKIWEKQFIEYAKMPIEERNEFMTNFAESEKFEELYNKWSHVDRNGDRPNFTCGYTDKVFSSLPDNRILIPDPLQVRRCERALKRPLTEEELAGEVDLIINGTAVELEFMTFPDDF